MCYFAAVSLERPIVKVVAMWKHIGLEHKDLRMEDQRNSPQGCWPSATWWVTTALLFVVSAYLYANLFVLPKTPIFRGGDQTYFWTDGQRMLFGERPYRDFFQFTPPGTDVFFFTLFDWFGPRIWVTNVAILALGTGLCWVCFTIARQIMSLWSALLATLLFLTLVYAKLLNATHHWFSMLFILCAVSVAMGSMGSARIAIVGLLLGVAGFFTHTHALAALLACALFLVWQHVRTKESLPLLSQRITILAVSSILAWIICNAYFLATVGIKQLWYYQVTYVVRYMVHAPEGAFLGLPEVPTWRRLPFVSHYFFVYALLATTYPLSLWQCWRRRHDPTFSDWDKVALLSLVGAALCLEVIFSLNWLRMFAVSMPAVILFIDLIGRSGQFGHYATRLIWTGVACLAILQVWSNRHDRFIVSDLPAGSAALNPLTYEKWTWISQHTRPGDFFFQPMSPSVYLALGLRSPVFDEGLGETDQTRPEFVARTIHQLEAKQVRYMVWSPRLEVQELDHFPSDHLSPFRAYLHDRYIPVWTFSDQEEIWQRKQQALDMRAVAGPLGLP